MNIRPLGVELFHAGGRTDGMRGTGRQADRHIRKLKVAVHNFANVPHKTVILFKKLRFLQYAQ